MPAACRIIPDRGWNPCPQHWWVDSYPLLHQGSPGSSLYELSLPPYPPWLGRCPPRDASHCLCPFHCTETLRMNPLGAQSSKQSSPVCFLSLAIQCNQTHPIFLFASTTRKLRTHFLHSVVTAAHNLSVGGIVILS